MNLNSIPSSLYFPTILKICLKTPIYQDLLQHFLDSTLYSFLSPLFSLSPPCLLPACLSDVIPPVHPLPSTSRPSLLGSQDMTGSVPTRPNSARDPSRRSASATTVANPPRSAALTPATSTATPSTSSASLPSSSPRGGKLPFAADSTTTIQEAMSYSPVHDSPFDYSR